MSRHRVALYPGTFDPLTNGHLDVLRRALRLFDEVIVAIAVSEQKRPWFSRDERLALAREATKDLAGVMVEPLAGLTVL